MAPRQVKRKYVRPAASLPVRVSPTGPMCIVSLRLCDIRLLMRIRPITIPAAWPPPFSFHLSAGSLMSKIQQPLSPSATDRLCATRAGGCRARILPRAVFFVLAGLSAGTAVAADSQSGELEEIVVYASQVTLPDAYAGGQVARGWRAGMLGNLDMMESPFAGTSFTSELMLDQQAISVADVLQNDPVVRVAKGFGNFQELYMIRGFPVFSDDMTYNGVYGILPRQFVAAELLERVEVFRGASAFLNGAAPGGSSLGGAVNLVPKRAPEDDLTRLTLGYTDQSHGVVALDASRRFGADDSTGVRLNLVRRDGETSVDGQDRA